MLDGGRWYSLGLNGERSFLWYPVLWVEYSLDPGWRERVFPGLKWTEEHSLVPSILDGVFSGPWMERGYFLGHNRGTRYSLRPGWREGYPWMLNQARSHYLNPGGTWTILWDTGWGRGIQQPLPLKWAAFGLTNSTSYSITHFIHVLNVRFVFALNPSCCCVCVNTYTHIGACLHIHIHTHTHTHTINSNHCQWFGRNQHFSGWTNSRDNITNGESSHTADRPWQVNEPFLLSGLSCKKPELENSIHISTSKVFIFYLMNVSQPINWHWNKLSLKSFWQKATK